MRSLGFVSAAAYRLVDDMLVQVLATPVQENGPKTKAGEIVWPPAVSHNLHYNLVSEDFLPIGWLKEPGVAGPRKLWPKGVNLYLPEQALQTDRFLIATVSATGKRCRMGELSGPLEAIAARLRLWYRESRERGELTEAGLKEHIRTLGIDLQMLVDHELRTPLSSITGYATLLSDPAMAQDAAQVLDYSGVIEAQAFAALEAVDKLSLALYADPTGAREESSALDAADELRDLCDLVRERAYELVGAEAAQRTSVRYHKNTDAACGINVRVGMFRGAVWEVLKNAVIHSKNGKVDVSVYVSDRMLVIDIADDGMGVSPGSEELIFLRFYQDHKPQSGRKGKKGLGLGLFLARHIVERHLGQLTFTRQRNVSLFRFLWPLADAGESLKKGA